MKADIPNTRRVRRLALALGAVGLFALVGCKTDKETKGSNVARGNDPLKPSLIPKQNVPVPDRATGPKGKSDPLMTPTGGKAAGYSDDPERFKGVVVPGLHSTPASLAGRLKDGDELKIADTGGVTLQPTGGTGAAPGGVEPPPDVEPFLTQLEKYGVTRADRSFERDGAKYAFRASVPISGNGAKREYVATAVNASDAVKQVLEQVAADRK